MKKHIAVYSRVSTIGQNLENQEPDLKAWLAIHGRDRSVTWYRDKFTGKTLKRPSMRKLEDAINAGRVDTVVVWRLDRLGRTASQTLAFLDDLEGRGVKFVSVRDGADTSTPAGRLLRVMIAGFAEYEREMISERIRSGIDRAKAEGKTWGGKKKGQRHKLTRDKMSAIRAMVEDGQKKTVIARELGIDRSTVYRAIELL